MINNIKDQLSNSEDNEENYKKIMTLHTLKKKIDEELFRVL